MQSQWGVRDRTRPGQSPAVLKPLVAKETDHPETTDWIQPALELGWRKHLLCSQGEVIAPLYPGLPTLEVGFLGVALGEDSLGLAPLVMGSYLGKGGQHFCSSLPLDL